MQSEANGPVWGPGIVPIILRNLCPGCHRVQYTDETRQFYPPDFKPEGPDDTAEGWCNGVGCMPGEQGVPGSYGAEHWSSPNGCHPDCPACAAEPVEELSTVVRKIPVEQPSFLMGVDRAESEELRAGKQTRSGLDCLDDMLSSGQVGPKGEDGPTGPCGGPVGPCGPDCVRFVTVSALPAGQPNRNEDIISPDAFSSTARSQPNAIQSLWDESKVSVPVDHVGIRGVSVPNFVRENNLAWFGVDYAGIELRVAEARGEQRADAKQKKAAELVLMPKELTAENGAKALLSGEFYEEFEVANPDYDPDCDDPDGEDYDEETAEPDFVTEKVPVTWDTIKKIYKMCVEGLSQPQEK